VAGAGGSSLACGVETRSMARRARECWRPMDGIGRSVGEADLTPGINLIPHQEGAGGPVVRRGTPGVASPGGPELDRLMVVGAGGPVTYPGGGAAGGVFKEDDGRNPIAGTRRESGAGAGEFSPPGGCSSVASSVPLGIPGGRPRLVRAYPAAVLLAATLLCRRFLWAFPGACRGLSGHSWLQVAVFKVGRDGDAEHMLPTI